MNRSQAKRLHSAASRVQEAYRAHASVRANVDPITLEHISKPFYRCVDIETNKVSYFDLHSLLDFLESTGDFRHPVTRRPLHPAQVFCLQQQARQVGRDTTVFERMRTLETRRTQLLQVESTLEFFLDRLEAMVNMVLQVCSTVEFSVPEMVIMIGPWTYSFRDGVLCVLGVLRSWQAHHDNRSVPVSLRTFGSRMVQKISAALSGPMYYSEIHTQHVLWMVGEMLRIRPTIEEWIVDLYVMVPPLL